LELDICGLIGGMAEEEKPKESPWTPLWFVGGVMAVLIFAWYYSGGPSRADLRGIFLNPPPPVGQGGAYGPEFSGQASTSQPATYDYYNYDY